MFSTRAEVIARRTYNRPLNDEGTVFETWAQTVDRVIGHQAWLWTRAAGTDEHLSINQEAELAELRQLMLERKVTVSGRTLWLGGTDISKTREASQFNPLPLDTQFIEMGGVAAFEDFDDGATVIALTHEGNWKPARVFHAGVREMRKLRLRRGRTVIDQKSSDDHTWILNDGRRVEARDIKIGDQLHVAPRSTFYDWTFDKAEADEQLWWCYGFVYGDGALAKSGNSTTSRVRLCGGKATFLPRFEACGFEHSFPPSCNADPFVYTGAYLKTLPTNAEPRLIKAFLRGYLDADGHKKNQRGETTFKGIVCSDGDAADFVRRWAPVFGLYILDDQQVARKTSYGMFEGAALSFTTAAQSLLWTVEGIEVTAPEPCACLTVEDDHSFVLPNGVVSGNCSFLRVETVSDIADSFWLLLQGCGVGFEPIPGILNGFTTPKEIKIVGSTRTDKGGAETNKETVKNGVWTIRVGDSAMAWAKAAAKIMANKTTAHTLVLDFSEIRPAGQRLKGYGWISSGWQPFAKAAEQIAALMNQRAGELLTRIDILDIMNHLGTTMSSRRSAEIALVPWADPEAEAFASAKRNWWEHEALQQITVTNTPEPESDADVERVMEPGEVFTVWDEKSHPLSAQIGANEWVSKGDLVRPRAHQPRAQRQQSNNSLMFYTRPSKYELAYVFAQMQLSGGSEPGFINAQAASKRAPWFKGCNPCAEILLGNKSFCNLIEVDLAKFNGDFPGLLNAMRLAARANYRQTCVDLRDEVLQSSWHELNNFLRLCGAGVTGIVGWELHQDPVGIGMLGHAARLGSRDMADELGLPRPKATTTIKPSGTLSKIMDTTEGIHKPLGRYIFNNVNFSKHDPVVQILRDAGYRIIENPTDDTAVLVTFPVAYENVEFDIVDGKHVNLETAVSQLNRYKLWMDNYVDHNCSITVSYSPDEVPAIVDWLIENWEHYVGVSFIYRNDPTKTAADLGYLYLPQQVVTEADYRAYADTLLPVDLGAGAAAEIEDGGGCATGACPIR